MIKPTKITVTLKHDGKESKPSTWGPGFKLLCHWLGKLTKQEELCAQLHLEDGKGNEQLTHLMSIGEAHKYVERITK